MCICEAVVGEELVCAREPHNSHDCYAVAVKREDVLIGHLPRKLSRLYSLFLRRGYSVLLQEEENIRQICLNEVSKFLVFYCSSTSPRK